MADLLTRRHVLLGAALCAMGTRPIRAGGSESPPPNGKGVFILRSMKQATQELDRQAKEEARRGELASIGPPPDIVPFGDWNYYYLKDGDLVWSPNPGQTFKKVFVPIGFVTDLASIPRIFWSALRPEGRYAYAAVIHDYLYWEQDRPKEQADEIFRIAMQDSKVDTKTVAVIYEAVKLLGNSAWKENRRLREAGEKRILKKFPTDSTITWSQWKKTPGVFAN